MSEIKIDRSKIAYLLQMELYADVLNNFDFQLLKSIPIDLLLIGLYSALKTNNKPFANQLRNQILKMNSQHQFVKDFRLNHHKKKLEDFVEAFTKIYHLNSLSEKDIDTILVDITVKRFIK